MRFGRHWAVTAQLVRLQGHAMSKTREPAFPQSFSFSPSFEVRSCNDVHA